MSALRVVVFNQYEQSLARRLESQFQVKGNQVSICIDKVFWLIEKEAGFIKANHEKLISVLFNEISEDIDLHNKFTDGFDAVAEVFLKPGVTDNLAHSATEAMTLKLSSLHSSWQEFAVEVHSGYQVRIRGDVNVETVKTILRSEMAPELLTSLNIFLVTDNTNFSALNEYASRWCVSSHKPQLQTFELKLNLLQQINAERGLSLSKSEIETIISYFSKPNVDRSKLGFDRKITDVELECLAQTWSEHCKHKIFNSEIQYSEAETVPYPIGTQNIKSIYKTYIKGATQQLSDKPYLVSVFSDNAGVVNYGDEINLCVKVETHNSPSALDPMSGAITGILGVHRDIMGTGIGAKPIANTDVFCFCHETQFPPPENSKRLPMLKTPEQIRNGVHRGVEAGGNQSGVPTVNGAFYFASEYAAKPLVYVGSIGVSPKQISGRPTHIKEIKAGYRVVVAGGRLGKDGVHGATFSSSELKENVSTQVVQMGDPITQKRLLDFTLVARDQNLIAAITDNGAGGISSSVGELAQISGGARIDLSKHALKYQGLEYYEMLISESQERMTYAVEPHKLLKFKELAIAYNVEVFDLGEFTDTQKFEVYYKDKCVAHLDLDFMHNGLQSMQLTAKWQGPKEYTPYYTEISKINPNNKTLLEMAKILLSAPNISSKERWVRAYDHEVQSATRVKPFVGKTQKGPSDAAVIDLHTHGGKENTGLAISCGLAPQYSTYDTYLMAQKACDEAVRNLICTGANPDTIALIDNFCWPDPIKSASNPDAQHKLAQLVRAAKGVYDAALSFRAPLISGKDSMKNDFIGKNIIGETVKLSVAPTLLATAVAHIEDCGKIVTSGFLDSGDDIFWLGKKSESVLASEYANYFDSSLENKTEISYPNLNESYELYKKIYQCISKGLIKSCHDISEGGMLIALIESTFANDIGADVDFSKFSKNHILSEIESQFIISAAAKDRSQLETIFGKNLTMLGKTTDAKTIQLRTDKNVEVGALEELKSIWSKGSFCD